jgi:hypothetical protein
MQIYLQEDLSRSVSINVSRWRSKRGALSNANISTGGFESKCFDQCQPMAIEARSSLKCKYIYKRI